MGKRKQEDREQDLLAEQAAKAVAATENAPMEVDVEEDEQVGKKSRKEKVK
jgi:hypothetical protein